MTRLRLAMVGGGPGAFIGPVHRIAAELDREIELVAGVFSSDAARSRAGAESYQLDPAKGYADLHAMIDAERPDLIAVVTPNHNHLASARIALEAGVAVMSDKPMTATLAEARELADIVARTGVPYALTYTYSGYPLVREMKARVAAGAIGTIRKVIVEYSQGWLAGQAEGKQAEWRVDPARAGAGGCIGDIGVHAFHLAEFVSGHRVTRIMPDLAAVVPDRTLDDDCTILLRFDNGARGVLMASQIEVGERNGLRIRLYGESGGMTWSQEEPNRVLLHHDDGRTEILHAGDAFLGEWAATRTRLPGGHPEGYLEAFANLYRDFAARLRGEDAPLLPGIDDGLRGMTFIDTSVRANAAGSGWTDLKLEERQI